ncbi:hypothetical protein AYO44_02815 [Planctomycetaceae bacterium SCGC AG-212-F19]|nr:hypothetical protein AYO44_02815 [Planctomycetaceae bacterium SCGC AG-212-F19]
MLHFLQVVTAFILLTSHAPAVQAADNELTPEEKAEGYVLLFNGKDLDGFRPPGTLNYCKWIVEEGTIRTCLFGHWAKYVPPGHLYTARAYENYVLKVDVKVPPAPKGTHSGIILRVGGMPRDDEAAGLEINIYGAQPKPNSYSTGSFRHDIRPPTKEMLKKDGDWNTFVVTVNKNRIAVELNGEKINELDLDEWDTPGKRPDGTAHKLTKVALKDMPRQGAIGFRDDHGSPVWYKNIKLKPLP